MNFGTINWEGWDSQHGLTVRPEEEEKLKTVLVMSGHYFQARICKESRAVPTPIILYQWHASYSSTEARSPVRSEWLAPYSSTGVSGEKKSQWHVPYSSTGARTVCTGQWHAPYSSTGARMVCTGQWHAPYSSTGARTVCTGQWHAPYSSTCPILLTWRKQGL